MTRTRNGSPKSQSKASSVPNFQPASARSYKLASLVSRQQDTDLKIERMLKRQDDLLKGVQAIHNTQQEINRKLSQLEERWGSPMIGLAENPEGYDIRVVLSMFDKKVSDLARRLGTDTPNLRVCRQGRHARLTPRWG